MSFKDMIVDTNLFSIFVFILIISANFLAEIFPCGLQEVLRNNMIIKHTFGFFTMIFFVVLSYKNKNKNIYDIIIKSFGLYLFFIVISRCEIHFFYFILIFLGITYIINILKHDTIKEEINKKEDKNKKRHEENNKKMMIYDNMTFILYILIILSTFFGLLISMGEKKIEYKKKFNYFTFFIGKHRCVENPPSINYIKSLQKSLS